MSSSPAGAGGGGARRTRKREGRYEATFDDEAMEQNSEGSGEDLIGDHMADDYQVMGVLDQYDSQMLDDNDYVDDPEARLQADAALQDRDRKERDDDEDGAFRPARRRRTAETALDAVEESEVEQPFDLDEFQVPLAEWLVEVQTKAEIKRRFRAFLDTYENPDLFTRHYERVIDKMCAEGASSLVISYLHLSRYAPTLAIWLADQPKAMLALFDVVAKEAVSARYTDYYNDVAVRVSAMPIPDSLRDLRQQHLNVLVRVRGVVTRRGAVLPQLSIVKFRCLKCQTLSAPQHIVGEPKHAGACIGCQTHGPFKIDQETTVYRNFQRMTLQESPGSVPAGRVPRSKDVILTGDIIDSARPGEEVDVTGVYTHQFDAMLNARSGFPVFSTLIEANFIDKLSDKAAHTMITDEDKAKFDALARDPAVVRRIVCSIAPSIYGNDRAKLAVALAMFGGREKNVNNKHRIRGDVNVLLLGDPGTAKSQILKYVEKTAPRCVYTTGKGASAVGLTASVHKDTTTGEWTLEAGALVLADRGVCCIDEFDKMTDEDRTSIHEAMEQQSISISKAGIVATLQARCAVVAAANPIGGRYDTSKTFSENVQLTDPILTRFDVLCVMRDEIDPVVDNKLAEFVVRSHLRSHPIVREILESPIEEPRAVSEDMLGIMEGARLSLGMSSLDEGSAAVGGDGSVVVPIEQDLLRKFIVHARTLKPSLTNIDQEKVADLYTQLRRESEVSNGIPIAVRHIESIMRISEASARMRLAHMVSDSDLNLAIKTTLESFVTAQKAGVQRTLRSQFGRYLMSDTNNNVLLLHKLRELFRKKQAERAGLGPTQDAALGLDVPLSKFLEAARVWGVTDVDEFLRCDLFKRSNFIYDGIRHVITRP